MSITDKIKKTIDDIAGTDLSDSSDELQKKDVVNEEGYNDSDDNVIDMMDKMHPSTKEVPLKNTK